MRNRSGIAVLALAILAAGAARPVPAEAGAWLQAPGTAYVRVSGGVLTTDQRFDPGGDRAPFDLAGAGFRDTQYEDLSGHLYAEVGVHRDWNLVLGASWKHLQANQPSAVFKTYGPGDASAAVKRNLWRGPRAVASAQASVILPTGYDVGDYPSLGSHVVDVAVAALAGASFPGYWATGEVEYMFRGGVFRDRLGGALGAGWGLSSRLGLRGEARGGVAVGAAEAGSGDLRFDPATVDPSYLDLAATLSLAVGGGLAVEAETRSTVWGRNTLTGTRWGLALATSPAWRWTR